MLVRAALLNTGGWDTCARICFASVAPLFRSVFGQCAAVSFHIRAAVVAVLRAVFVKSRRSGEAAVSSWRALCKQRGMPNSSRCGCSGGQVEQAPLGEESLSKHGRVRASVDRVRPPRRRSGVNLRRAASSNRRLRGGGPWQHPSMCSALQTRPLLALLLGWASMFGKTGVLVVTPVFIYFRTARLA